MPKPNHITAYSLCKVWQLENPLYMPLYIKVIHDFHILSEVLTQKLLRTLFTKIHVINPFISLCTQH